MPTGFGQQPAGVSTGGLGTPAGLPSPGSGYEPLPGLVAARALDLAALDYKTSGDLGSPFDHVGPLEQQVELRLTTRRGRLPFAADLGNDFLNLRKAPADLLASARNSAEAALADLIGDGLVQIVSVDVRQEGGLAAEAVTWLDTAKNQRLVTLTTAGNR